ncbi:MAG: hypothetical protein WCV59_01250 [Parcubacteria group bacterium]
MLDTAKETIISLFSDTVTELFSLNQMKKYISSALGNKVASGIAGTGETTAETAGPELKFGGFLNLSDTAIYLDLCGRLMEKLEKKDPRALAKIVAFQKKHLDGTQNERFRVSLGILYHEESCRVTKERHEIPRAKSAPEVKEKTTEIRTNPAVRFLIAFSKLTNHQKLNLLDSTGVLKGDWERKLEKFKKWASENKNDVISGLDGMNKKIAGRNPGMSYWANVFDFRLSNSPTKRVLFILGYASIMTFLLYTIATVGGK